jgi:hypothetical protein
MFLLVPLLEITQAQFVITLKRTALDVEKTGNGGAGDGEAIQDSL